MIRLNYSKALTIILIFLNTSILLSQEMNVKEMYMTWKRGYQGVDKVKYYNKIDNLYGQFKSYESNWQGRYVDYDMSTYNFAVDKAWYRKFTADEYKALLKVGGMFFPKSKYFKYGLKGIGAGLPQVLKPYITEEDYFANTKVNYIAKFHEIYDSEDQLEPSAILPVLSELDNNLDRGKMLRELFQAYNSGKYPQLNEAMDETFAEYLPEHCKLSCPEFRFTNDEEFKSTYEKFKNLKEENRTEKFIELQQNLETELNEEYDNFSKESFLYKNGFNPNRALSEYQLKKSRYFLMGAGLSFLRSVSDDEELNDLITTAEFTLNILSNLNEFEYDFSLANSESEKFATSAVLSGNIIMAGVSFISYFSAKRSAKKAAKLEQQKFELLLKYLRGISNQLDTRFNEVDRKLKIIYEGMNESFLQLEEMNRLIQSGLDENSRQLANINSHVKRIQGSLRVYITELIENEVNKEYKLCTDALQLAEADIDFDDFSECIVRLVHYCKNLPNQSALNFNPTIDDPHEILKKHSNNLSAFIYGTRSIDWNSPISPLSDNTKSYLSKYRNVGNYEAWVYSTNLLAKLLSENLDLVYGMNKTLLLRELNEISTLGERIKDANYNLIYSESNSDSDNNHVFRDDLFDLLYNDVRSKSKPISINLNNLSKGYIISNYMSQRHYFENNPSVNQSLAKKYVNSSIKYDNTYENLKKGIRSETDLKANFGLPEKDIQYFPHLKDLIIEDSKPSEMSKSKLKLNTGLFDFLVSEKGFYYLSLLSDGSLNVTNCYTYVGTEEYGTRILVYPVFTFNKEALKLYDVAISTESGIPFIRKGNLNQDGFPDQSGIPFGVIHEYGEHRIFFGGTRAEPLYMKKFMSGSLDSLFSKENRKIVKDDILNKNISEFSDILESKYYRTKFKIKRDYYQNNLNYLSSNSSWDLDEAINSFINASIMFEAYLKIGFPRLTVSKFKMEKVLLTLSSIRESMNLHKEHSIAIKCMDKIQELKSAIYNGEQDISEKRKTIDSLAKELNNLNWFKASVHYPESNLSNFFVKIDYDQSSNFLDKDLKSLKDLKKDLIAFTQKKTPGYDIEIDNTLMELNSLIYFITYFVFDEEYLVNLPDINRIRTLHLPNMGLGKIVEGLDEFDNVENLYLMENGIDSLLIDSNLKHIKRLDLSGNEINEITLNGEQESKIQDLILNNNKIKNLPNNIWALKNLSKLDISKNEIENLNINNEIELDLSLCDNNLKSLTFMRDNRVNIYTNVKSFNNLSFNSCSPNEKKFYNCKDSSEIDFKVISADSLLISNSNITELPKFDYEKTSYISANNNQISSFDFKDYPNLIQLNLNTNSLHEFTADFSQLTSLKDIDLGNNKIDVIDISGISNQRITMGERGVSEISIMSSNYTKGILDLESGKLEFLNGGQIIAVPFKQNGALNTNYTCSLDTLNEIIDRLSEVKIIDNDYKRCSIEILSDKNVLDLSSNNISSFKLRFKDDVIIDKLILRDNQIKKIPNSLLKNGSIKQIDLRNNKLSDKYKSRLLEKFENVVILVD